MPLLPRFGKPRHRLALDEIRWPQLGIAATNMPVQHEADEGAIELGPEAFEHVPDGALLLRPQQLFTGAPPDVGVAAHLTGSVGQGEYSRGDCRRPAWSASLDVGRGARMGPSMAGGLNGTFNASFGYNVGGRYVTENRSKPSTVYPTYTRVF